MPDDLTTNAANKPDIKSGRGKRPTNYSDLTQVLDRTEIKLHRTEMLLSVTQKIAGLSNLISPKYFGALTNLIDKFD